MDRDAVARSQRRRQIEEARAEEQRRELVLAERLEEVVTEQEGARVDAEAFMRMEPEHGSTPISHKATTLRVGRASRESRLERERSGSP